jgi:hypothetical protein
MNTHHNFTTSLKLIQKLFILTSFAVLLDRMTLYNDKNDLSLWDTFAYIATAPPDYNEYIIFIQRI